MRCRPELAPGHAPVDSARTIARAAAARIETGALSDSGNLEGLAASLGLSTRQLRRSVRKELGVSPVELAQTNRLLLAKRLIAETRLPMVQVAFAAGFASVRRFNALFRSHYRLTPSTLRRASSKAVGTDFLRLMLAYRPPLDWDAMLRFLAARAIPGVECVTDTAYHRTVGIGALAGLSVALVANRNLLAGRYRHRGTTPTLAVGPGVCAICSIWMLGRTSSPNISHSIPCWRRGSSTSPACVCQARSIRLSLACGRFWDNRFPCALPRRLPAAWPSALVSRSTRRWLA